MLRAFRWIAFLPLAFAASVVASAAFSFLGELVGGGAWYIWSVSGAAAAFAFFAVAFRVAPARTLFVKWSAVAIVALLGAISAAGSLMAGNERIRALSGLLMVAFAVVYARMPIETLASELQGQSESATA